MPSKTCNIYVFHNESDPHKYIEISHFFMRPASSRDWTSRKVRKTMHGGTTYGRTKSGRRKWNPRPHRRR